MAKSSSLFRSIIDEGISLFPNMQHYTLRKVLIILTSPYLLYRCKTKKGDVEILPQEKTLQGEFLDYTEMFITSYCNLKCKYCSASIPYYYNKYHIDAEFLCKQVNAYLDAIDGVETFRILGGEPFLHPQLADILTPLVNSEKIHSLHLVTNGAIVPHDPKVLKILQNKKIWLDISNYGAVSNKVPELQALEKRGLIQLNIDTVTSWFVPNHKYDSLNLEPQELADRYHNCPDYCHVLRDGKFFSCGEAFHIANIPNSPMRAGIDYVDLFDGAPCETKRQEILDVAFKRKPSMSGCNHCGGGSFIFKDRILVAGEQPKEGEVVDFDLPVDIPVVSTKMI